MAQQEINDKIIEMIQFFIELTRSGQLAWKAGTEFEKFYLPSRPYTIGVQPVPSTAENGRYAFTIINDDGNTIFSTVVSDGDSGFAEIKTLHEVVMKHNETAIEAINDILQKMKDKENK